MDQQMSVPDPNIRSAKARDRTSSGIAHDIKEVRPEDIGFQKLNFLAGREKLHLLVVANRSYEEQRRESNYGPNSRGKHAAVGVPTGGGEANEATDNTALRELFDETGYQPKHIICLLSDFIVMKKNRKGDQKGPHPHYPYLVEAETGLARDIREKKEIRWSRWITICEVIERLKLCKQPQNGNREDYGRVKKNRPDPESFYYTHAGNFLFPFYFRVYFMKPEEIAAEKNWRYREWLTKYQPYIIEELDEHADELAELKLLPAGYKLNENDNNQEPPKETPENIEGAIAP